MTKSLARLADKRILRVAGLMSGTSADGVSAAIVDVGPRGAKLLAFRTFPYPPALRGRIFALFEPRAARADDLCRMNFVLGEAFAAALVRLARRARIPLASIDLVGSHGQTVCHLPAERPRSTLQIGEPSVIAERTGIATVADFRPRDVAAGGEGAPLVPLADWLLFAHPRKRRAVQNLGGIANVTWLPPNRVEGGRWKVEGSKTGNRQLGTGNCLLAFDTGPGNMIIDRLAARATRGRLSFDRGGRLAARGKVDERLLAELLAHPFLRRPPPKSTGREEFGTSFADGLWRRGRSRGLSAADLVATATAFTAESVAEAYRRFLPRLPDEVVLCGGGARNPVLLEMLRAALLPARVAPMDDFGLDAEAKEAVSFALLAWAFVKGVPGNVPAATGARRPAVLGKFLPGRP